MITNTVLLELTPVRADVPQGVNLASLEFGKGWRQIEERPDGKAFLRWDGLVVIVSWSQESDEKMWLHISASLPSRLPTWNELVEIKKMVLGDNAYAVQVMLPKAFHVNINPNVAHIWSCLNGHPLPEFSRGLGTI